MACLACGRNFHDECENGSCASCHPDLIKLEKSISMIGIGVGAPIKDPKNIKDRHSTGRKRAAMLYPIFRDQECAWRGKKNCGGGIPIIGCIAGLQRDLHHGPVKDTLRNEPTNIHKICKNCHARWHAVNDPTYNEEEWNKTSHQPEIADGIELLANEAYWRVK